MIRIIFDTNSLIYSLKYRIDLFSEIERICQFQYTLGVLDTTLKELERLQPKGLALIKKYCEKMQVIKAEESYVDDELARLSKLGNIIVTQDQGLKKKLKGPLITIRQKKYLELKRM